MNIKIIVADDHKIMREGLSTLIDKQAGMEVVGEAEDGRMAVKLVSELSPDIILMDIEMPALNGIEATSQITSEFMGTSVIVLSMHSEKKFVSNVLRMGASGYLLKDCAFEELIDAINTVKNNKIFLSPGIADIVIEDYICWVSNEDKSVFSVLTGREREVLQLIAEGKSTKEISSILFVSIKTIESHRKKIMGKLGVHSIADLTKYAVREGVTSL